MDKPLDLEHRLILLSARTHCDSLAARKLRATATAQLDWERICHIADEHGVRSLVFHTLKKQVKDLVPPHALEQLRSATHQYVFHSLFLVRHLGELVQLFEEHEIPVLAFKGPITASESYGDLARRGFGDLDLLIHPHHVQAATELLERQGFQAVHPLPDRLDGTYALPFQDPQGNANGYSRSVDGHTLHVDLHWDMTARYFSFPVEVDGLFARQRRIAINGTEVPTFSPEDTLLILCAHGSKHQWTQLRYVCDVSECIRSHPDLDWSEVLSRAEETDSVHILRLGLDLADSLLNAPVPEPVLEQLTTRRAETLYNLAQRKLTANNPSRASKLVITWLYHLLLMGRLRDGLRACLFRTTLSLRPTEEDKRFISLPSYLYPLYYLIRPLRIFWESLPSRQTKILKP